MSLKERFAFQPWKGTTIEPLGVVKAALRMRVNVYFTPYLALRDV